jgi:hypothetical protein
MKMPDQRDDEAALAQLRTQAQEAVAVLAEGARAMVNHVASTLGVTSAQAREGFGQLQFPGIISPAEAAERAQEFLSRMGPPPLLIHHPGAAVVINEISDFEFDIPGLATRAELEASDDPRKLLHDRHEGVMEAAQRAVDGQRFTGTPEELVGRPEEHVERLAGVSPREEDKTRYLTVAVVVPTYGTHDQAMEAAKRVRRMLTVELHQPVIFDMERSHQELSADEVFRAARRQACSCYDVANPGQGPVKDVDCNVHGRYPRA